jgi:hypothetical protein
MTYAVQKLLNHGFHGFFVLVKDILKRNRQDLQDEQDLFLKRSILKILSNFLTLARYKTLLE